MIEHPAALDPLSGFPYSNVVVSGDLVATASQVPFDENNLIVGPDFADQAHQVFANLRQCLRVAGCDFADVIKVSGSRRAMSLGVETSSSPASMASKSFLRVAAASWTVARERGRRPLATTPSLTGAMTDGGNGGNPSEPGG